MAVMNFASNREEHFALAYRARVNRVADRLPPRQFRRAARPCSEYVYYVAELHAFALINLSLTCPRHHCFARNLVVIEVNSSAADDLIRLVPFARDQHHVAWAGFAYRAEDGFAPVRQFHVLTPHIL